MRRALAVDDGREPDLPAHDLLFAALGGMVHALYSDMGELREQLNRTGRMQRSPLVERLAEASGAGAVAGLKEELKAWGVRLDGCAAAHSRLSRLIAKTPGKA